MAREAASEQGVRQPRVLVVDDERLLHGVLSRLFGRHGIEAVSCMSAPQALEQLKEEAFDLVITDFQMPEMDGLELLARVRDMDPRLPVIMITGHASIQHAVRALSGGAVDYLPKPFSTDVLVERVKEHLAKAAAADEVGAAEEPAARPARGASKKAPKAGAVTFVGEHPSVRQIRSLLPRFAKSKAPVFIHGESGTGKEVLARLIHQESDRAGGPFVAINCANLPSELVESHLFGHKKGAFTGAIEDMEGAFGRAHGGTLLLDEVTEVSPSVQAKLLRVLQEEEFQRVGSDAVTRVDVRVIATSNRDLQEAVQQGAFREDLYHRLAVFPLYVPPLRERASDVRLLAEAFVERYCRLYDLPPKTLAPDLLQEFQAYAWPGNVRELGNMIHRGVVLAAEREVVERDDVMHAFFVRGTSAEAASLATDGPLVTIAEMERRMILRALLEHDYNQQRAADQLGICARTIRNKLKKYREEGHLEGTPLRRAS